MRRPLATALVKAFERRIQEQMPQFRRLTDVELPDDCRAYAWPAERGLCFHLLLQPHSSEDSFTLEIGFSRNATWPVYVSPPVSAKEAASASETRFRIGLLWSDNPDYWWDLAPRPSAVPLEDALADYGAFLQSFRRPPVSEILSNVEPAVSDALLKIREHAVPYFEEIAKSVKGRWES
jgi:hypothetical protein